MSNYKEQINNMIWSFSRVASFDNCPYGFYLTYIEKDENVHPLENNFWAENGGFVHELLEKIFKKEITIDEALQIYVNDFDDRVKAKVSESTLKKTFELCCDYFAEADFNFLDDYEILGVELELKFQLEGYDFVTYVDLLLRDKRDGKIIIVDHKSSDYPFKTNGEVKKNAEDNFKKYKKQMNVYAHAVKVNFGEYPKELTWNHFKVGGKFATIKFDKRSYNATIKWLVDTIHKIEKEENFPAKPTFFFCSNLCNFKSSCEYIPKKKYYRRKRKR